VGFSAGYLLESFRVTVYAVFLGVGVASLICVPDWGVFRGKGPTLDVSLAHPSRLCPLYISLTIVWAITIAILTHGFRCVDRITSVSCAGRQGAAGLGAGRLQGAAKTERMMIAGRRPPIAGRLKNVYAAESSPRGRHGPARTRRAARVGPEGRRWGAWFGHE
jgi:hypothetical protein